MVLVRILALCASVVTGHIEVGVGISDITGPSVQTVFSGFGKSDQIGTGILNRCRARAFVWKDTTTNKVIAFVSLDGGQNTDQLHPRVIRKLNEKRRVPGVFDYSNLMISVTHAHSAPGGYQTNVMQFVSLGFSNQTLETWVEGTARAITWAYWNKKRATTTLSLGRLFKANINRSPTSYELNPAEERALYDGDTDQRFLQLKIVDEEFGNVTGIVNWFAVHGTSLNVTNTLAAGDNKGYASYQVERLFNLIDNETKVIRPDRPAGTGPFVAAFASSNLGDLSPNTQGAICHDGLNKGKPCTKRSLCDLGLLNPHFCYSLGPSRHGDMYESNHIIGKLQSDKALELMDADKHKQIPMTGKIDHRHSFVPFPEREVTLDNGEKTKLCWPAWGISFMAGTTDGTAAKWFVQGEKTGSLNPLERLAHPLMKLISGDLLQMPTKDDEKCHKPKPLLLHFGPEMTEPVMWYPHILPIQIHRIGCLFILAVPGEFTTMAGRRLRRKVEEVLKTYLPKGECDEVYTTIAGLGNSYAGYITTYEEYQAQRYEAASTMYGPYTLDAHIQEFSRLAKDMALDQETTTQEGPREENVTDTFSLIPDPQLDRCPTEGDTSCFGNVLTQPKSVYHFGETVKVDFQAANPRHHLEWNKTYLTLHRILPREGGTFKEMAEDEGEILMTDADWATRFEWESRETRERKKNKQKVCGSILPRLWKILKGLWKVLTKQGDFKDDSTGINAVKFLRNITKANLNKVFCFSDTGPTESYATLSLHIDEKWLGSSYDKYDPYELHKGYLKLCYHGHSKTEENQNETVGFTGCSRPFRVENPLQRKKKEL